MENAVKALIMSAGVLIGVMIISLGVALFSSLSRYTDSTQKQLEENALQQFNQKFTKFINWNDDSSKTEFTLTIQDIVTAANTAYESNIGYGLEAPSDYNYYVTVNMPGVLNLERSINTIASELLKNNVDKEYKCTYEDVKINENTDRVCEINFTGI